MSDRPTPETDAELHGINAVCKEDRKLDAMTSHARKLERERDEAREEIEALRHEYHGAKAMASGFKDKIKSLTEERDEAREENKKFREALEWIAERYDDFKPLHSVAMDAYEMSCIAKSALRKEES